MHGITVTAAAVGVLLAALAGSSLQAQDTQPASGPVLQRYADPAFGFDLQVPAGWSYDRTRFHNFKDSIGLLRGHAPGGRRGLQIQVFRSFPMKPFENWWVDFAEAAAQLLNSERTDWEAWRLPPRAGVILTFTGRVTANPARTYTLCMPFDGNTVWVFTYSGSVSSEPDQKRLRAEFDQIIATLKVHYDPEQQEKLNPAFAAAEKLIKRLHGLADSGKLRNTRIDDHEYFYELTLAGKPLGYFQRRVAREEYTFSAPGAKRRSAKEGIRVREQTWRFAEDGSIRFGRSDLFSSFDLLSEVIESAQVHIPPGARDPNDLLIRTEQVTREANVLISSYDSNLETSPPEPSKPLSVGPRDPNDPRGWWLGAYLDLAWVRLLPGILIDEAADRQTKKVRPGGGELYAVAMYSSDIRALVPYTLRVRAEQTLPDFEGAAFEFEAREGFIDAPTKFYTDAKGNLLQLETGELKVTRVPREAIDRKYGTRRDEVIRKFNLKVN